MSESGITVIIPAYNEEDRIENCLERIHSYLKSSNYDFEMIFVVDGSTDNTCSIIDGYKVKENRVKLLKIDNRIGKGGSLICAALECPLKDYVCYMDADLASDPSELERLLEYIRDYDIVIGSRILRGNLLPIKRPIHRQLLSRLYSKLFRILFRIPICDPQSGFKLFRREIVSRLFSEIRVGGFAFDTDLLVTASSQDLRIKEVPINWTHQSPSKVSILREVRSMGRDLFSVWFRYHLLWKQNRKVYPEKKGSICGRILFALLSLYNSKFDNPSLYRKFSELEPLAPAPNEL